MYLNQGSDAASVQKSAPESNSYLTAMIEAILFDLDDTLLSNSIDRFLPRYFALLGEYAAPKLGDRKRFLRVLMDGTQAMIMDTDGATTNRAVFWKRFEEMTGKTVEEMEPFFDQFYETVFPQLCDACAKRPIAAEMVQACFDRDLKVVIATNPVFPRRAVEERLAWAGLPVDSFPFTLVTSYENMHATKPNVAYYREILQQVEVQPNRAVMIGDDWENDIAPAKSIGLRTYWITSDSESAHVPDPGLVDGYGSLNECHEWLTSVLSGVG